jgi:hypothetical protein
MRDPANNSSHPTNGTFLRKAANHAEALSNLIYLICEEAEHPAKVRHYASLSEQSLQALTQLLLEQRYPQ